MATSGKYISDVPRRLSNRFQVEPDIGADPSGTDKIEPDGIVEIAKPHVRTDPRRGRIREKLRRVVQNQPVGKAP